MRSFVRPFMRSSMRASAILAPALALPLAFSLTARGMPPATADQASDAPETRAIAEHPVAGFDSYAEALAAWRAPDEVNAWIGARFEYDANRALALSEDRRAAHAAPPIHDPQAFFARPVGVCVDLARFAVETLERIAPDVKPRYLMIEFAAAAVPGHLLRRHWVAAYERDGGHYFFADSRRPGVIAGPYPSVDAFVADYARFRDREIVAFRELDTFRRQARIAAQRKRQAD